MWHIDIHIYSLLLPDKSIFYRQWKREKEKTNPMQQKHIVHENQESKWLHTMTHKADIFLCILIKERDVGMANEFFGMKSVNMCVCVCL